MRIPIRNVGESVTQMGTFARRMAKDSVASRPIIWDPSLIKGFVFA